MMKFTVISSLLIPCSYLLSDEEEEPYDPTKAKYPGDLTEYFQFNSVLLFVIQVNILRKVSRESYKS